MYCRYAKTSVWDHKQCPLNGGEFYCVLYRERPGGYTVVRCDSQVHPSTFTFNLQLHCCSYQ